LLYKGRGESLVSKLKIKRPAKLIAGLALRAIQRLLQKKQL